MSQRNITIWNLLVGMSIFSLIAMGMKIFPMDKKYSRMKSRSENIEFGTDKKLENVISYLEKRLEDQSVYKFSLKTEPMHLTNVLQLADGSGKSRRRDKNAVRVALVYQSNDRYQAQIDYRGNAYNVKIGDLIPNIGSIEHIDGKEVIIKTSLGKKSYPVPNKNNILM